jgi:hypothetical protein
MGRRDAQVLSAATGTNSSLGVKVLEIGNLRFMMASKWTDRSMIQAAQKA